MTDLITMITDASYNPELKLGGWGAWARNTVKSVLNGGGFFYNNPYISSSHEAEYLAIAQGLYMLHRNDMIVPGCKIIVQTDSTLAAGRMPEWWPSKDPKDVSQRPTYVPPRTPLEEHAHDQINKMVKEYAIRLFGRHIRGHQHGRDVPRNRLNKLVHDLANRGRRRAEFWQNAKYKDMSNWVYVLDRTKEYQ